MSSTSGQANDTPLNGQRPNYGSLTHLNQPAAVRTRAGPNPNAPSPASSLKSRQRQQDGTGTGTVAGVGAGTAAAGARNTGTSHRSVQITVPGQDEHGNAHANNDQDGDDTSSTSSRSSYSTYSSSTGSLHALDHHSHKGHSHREGCEPGEEEEEETSSRRMFWTYVGLTPILLSILVLFAVLLQFLPSSAESGEYIVHWDRFGEGAIGWTIAFAARTPLFALFSKTLSHSHSPQEDFYLCEWSTLLSAGALEEALRLAIILFLGIGEDFGAVYWLGLGWAGVETAYYIGQSLVYTRWLASPSSDEDYRTAAAGIGNGVAATTNMVVAPTVSTSLLPSANGSAGGPSTSTSTSETPSSLESGYTNGKSRVTNHTDIETEDLVPTREARHLLGLDRPWWSLMGRTSSMMVHIGLCCWLGHSGWRLLLPAAAVHGSLYVIWGVFMPDGWSVPATSYGTWIAALGVFLIGLALYGEII